MREMKEQTPNFENRERLKRAAKNIIDCFAFDPKKESFLFITDGKAIEENNEFVDAIRNELADRTDADPHTKGNWEQVIVPASLKSATPFGDDIGKKMKNRPILIVTSMSRSHSKETGAAYRGDIPSKAVFEAILGSENLRNRAVEGTSVFTPERLDELDGEMPDELYEKMEAFAKKHRSRIVSITKGHNPYEILTKGAVEEPVEKLKERAEKLNELMSDVDTVQILVDNGTNLTLNIRPDLTEIEDGDMSEPGDISNFPIGEWSCSPDWKGSSGTMVVDGPCGGNINQDIFDKSSPFTLTIEDGQIVNIDGSGEAVEIWKKYLDSGNNERNDAYRLAELGIGTNSKALNSKPREYWGSSEGEKTYGTVHVAVGSNGVFGRKPGEEGYNAAEVHCDMVLGLNMSKATVICTKNDGEKFTLIKEGEPQGY